MYFVIILLPALLMFYLQTTCLNGVIDNNHDIFMYTKKSKTIHNQVYRIYRTAL